MFMNSLTQLSKKDGIVSVRQGGWNTGWYRQQSRIVGIFRAVSITDQVKRRDGLLNNSKQKPTIKKESFPLDY
jgi:hypothetical protein